MNWEIILRAVYQHKLTEITMHLYDSEVAAAFDPHI